MREGTLINTRAAAQLKTAKKMINDILVVRIITTTPTKTQIILLSSKLIKKPRTIDRTSQ